MGQTARKNSVHYGYKNGESAVLIVVLKCTKLIYFELFDKVDYLIKSTGERRERKGVEGDKRKTGEGSQRITTQRISKDEEGRVCFTCNMYSSTYALSRG